MAINGSKKPFKNTNSPKSKAKQLQTKAATFSVKTNNGSQNAGKIVKVMKSNAKAGKSGGKFKSFIGQ